MYFNRQFISEYKHIQLNQNNHRNLLHPCISAMLKQMMWTKSRNFLFLLQYWLMSVWWKRHSCIILRPAGEGEASCTQQYSQVTAELQENCHWHWWVIGACIPHSVRLGSCSRQRRSPERTFNVVSSRPSIVSVRKQSCGKTRQRPVSSSRPETRRSLSTRHSSCTGAGYSSWSLTQTRPHSQCTYIDYRIGISPVITRQLIRDQYYYY